MDRIFSKEALDARRPTPISRPASLLLLPTRLVIGTLFTAAFLATVWAAVAPIPIRVPASGIILDVNQNIPVSTNSSGRVILFSPEIVTLRQTVDREIISFYFQRVSELPSTKQMIRLANALLEDSTNQSFRKYAALTSTTSLAETIGTSGFAVKEHQILGLIINETERADMRMSVGRTYSGLNEIRAARRAALTDIEMYQKEFRLKSDLVSSYEGLLTHGASDNQQVLSAKSAAAQTATQITNLKSRLAELEAKEKSAQAELFTSLKGFINKHYIISPAEGYIASLDLGTQQLVEAGTTVMSISSAPPSQLPDQVIGFVDDNYSSLVRTGMKVVATPQGVDKSQYGGIKGYITQVLPYSKDRETIAKLSGLQSAVSAASNSDQTPTVILMALEKVGADNQYRWTGNSRPDAAPRVGVQLDISIAVDTQTPLQIAIPYFKKYTGLEGPTTFTGNQ